MAGLIKKPVHWEKTLSKNFTGKIIGFEKWVEDNYKKYHEKI